MNINQGQTAVPTFDVGAQELFKQHDEAAPDVCFSLADQNQFNPDTQNYINGQYWLCRYHSGSFIGVRDLEVSKNFITRSKLNNMLSFEYILSGGSDMELNQQLLLNDGVPRLYVASYDINGQQTRIHKSGDHIQGVGLWLSGTLLKDFFGLETEEFSSPLHQLLSFEHCTALSFSLNTQIKDILKAIIAMPKDRHLSAVLLQAKTTELLCSTFDLLKASPQQAHDNHQLSKHKAKAMGIILQSINNNLASPPPIDELAQHVGLSRSNLLTTFKNSCGMSYSDYLSQQRMESAQSLIKGGRCNILETALAVGYNDQSAFGRAYKRYYGHPPKNDRP